MVSERGEAEPSLNQMPMQVHEVAPWLGGDPLAFPGQAVQTVVGEDAFQVLAELDADTLLERLPDPPRRALSHPCEHLVGIPAKGEGMIHEAAACHLPLQEALPPELEVAPLTLSAVGQCRLQQRVELVPPVGHSPAGIGKAEGDAAPSRDEAVDLHQGKTRGDLTFVVQKKVCRAKAVGIGEQPCPRGTVEHGARPTAADPCVICIIVAGIDNVEIVKGHH